MMTTALIATLFMIVVVAVVFWSFLSHDSQLSSRSELSRLSGQRQIRCAICGHVYKDIPAEDLSRCPICKSFNEIRPPEGTSSEKPDLEQPPPKEEEEQEKTT
jgi:LSD1 subclass zinc finger protein